MTNRDDGAIVRAIISLAHSLRLRVVAEGVETDVQLAAVCTLGCDEYQGYLCSPPVDADQLGDDAPDQGCCRHEEFHGAHAVNRHLGGATVLYVIATDCRDDAAHRRGSACRRYWN